MHVEAERLVHQYFIRHSTIPDPSHAMEEAERCYWLAMRNLCIEASGGAPPLRPTHLLGKSLWSRSSIRLQWRDICSDVLEFLFPATCLMGLTVVVYFPESSPSSATKSESQNMIQPEGLAEYKKALSKGSKPNGGGAHDGGGSDDGPTDDRKAGNNDRDFGYNSKFEDIRETWQDGEIMAVTRTQAQYKQLQMNKKRFGEYSLLLRRMVDLKNKRKPIIQLELQSNILRREFRRLCQGRVTTISLNKNPIVIPEPYIELYHSLESVRKKILEEKTPRVVRRELQLLISFQETYMADIIATIDSFKSSSTIEFSWIWGLFGPGCPVVIQNTSATTTPVEWCATVKSFETQRNPIEGVVGNVGILTLRHTAFNGQRFGKGQSVFTFPEFSGVIPINQLPAYPLEYHEKRDQFIEKAVASGKEYEQYCSASAKDSSPPVGTTKMYNGPFWTPRGGDGRNTRGCRMYDSPSSTINGRVIVDLEGFLSDYPQFRETLLPDGREDPDDPDAFTPNDSDNNSLDVARDLIVPSLGLDRGPHKPNRVELGTGFSSLLERAVATPSRWTGSLPKDQLQTCPPLVPVYSLTTRQWGMALVRELRDVQWNTHVYEKLQVDVSTKRTIHAVVKSHCCSPASALSSGFDDFIQGKGGGLVFLLHGPPGCGKTMTAESIAESLKKPLYTVNGGELGTSAESIQAALEKVFRLVSRWDAIFLLDEADAFLAHRGQTVEKNAPISVFLRVLEYQAGVVFLTTNRLRDIDKAFHSRIHASIEYPALDESKKTAIWRELAKEKCGGLVLTDKEAHGLARLPGVDGRSIKNVLRLASLFATARVAGAGGLPGEGTSASAKMCFADIKAVLPLAMGKLDKLEGGQVGKYKEEERL